MKFPVSGLTAAVIALSLSGAQSASAAPSTSAPADHGVAVTILSPAPRAAFNGVKPVEISAFYQGSAGNPISTLELYVDGVKAATKTLDSPEARGVVSFLVDAAALTGGTHKIVIRAEAADQEVASARGSFIFQMPTPAEPPTQITLGGGGASDTPSLSFLSPASDNKVQGLIKLRVNATDPSGKPPYVSLFIDRAFKTLKNYPPYEFEWDTTTYANGFHTVEIFGYNDTQNVGHGEPLRIFVNNPGGRTGIRTDLKDAPPATRIKVIKPTVHAPVVAKTITPLPPLPVAKAAPAPLRPVKGVAPAPKPVVEAPQPVAILQPNTAVLSDPLAAATMLPKAPSAPAPAAVPASAPAPVIEAAPSVEAAPVAVPEPVIAEVPKAVAPPVKVAAPRIAIAPKKAKRPTQIADARIAHLEAVQARPWLPIVKARLSKIHVPAAPALPRHLVVHTPSLATAAHLFRAAGQMSVLFNYHTVRLDRPLAVHEGLMFSPMRQIFEYQGGSLTWQPVTHTVTAHSASKDVQVTIGKKQGQVNHQPLMLEAAPYLNKGRTMVPFSFLKSAMDVTIQYDETSGHLLVTSKK